MLKLNFMNMNAKRQVSSEVVKSILEFTNNESKSINKTNSNPFDGIDLELLNEKGMELYNKWLLETIQRMDSPYLRLEVREHNPTNAVFVRNTADAVRYRFDADGYSTMSYSWLKADSKRSMHRFGVLSESAISPNELRKLLIERFGYTIEFVL